MRYIILLVVIAICADASAQIKRLPGIVVPKIGQPYYESNTFPPVTVKPAPIAKAPQAKLLMTLENGTQVYALPQDKMPCLVPDMHAYNNMPNAVKITIQPYRYNGPGAIPNPAQPIMKETAKK